MMAVAGPALAQLPVTATADPEALFTSADPKLHANKQVILHVVRDLLEANHWDQAERYIAKDYIQHNPMVPTGLDPLLEFFGSRPKSPIPDRKSWKTKVVSVTAEGDRVVVAFVREEKDPKDPAKTYTTTWFDMWRVKDGKAVEHWDGATLPPAPPAVASNETDADEIRRLVAAYAKAVDGADTKLAGDVWANTADVTFIHPLGHERGWVGVKTFFERVMGETFSERRLTVKDLVVNASDGSAWAEFYWDFAARFRKDGAALETHGRETQNYRKVDGRWRLVHVHYSGMPVTPGGSAGF
jgi:predicted SnoaL-like aldol condensation-catalyzing enzyme/ketosteroid isomerase-like protein